MAKKKDVVHNPEHYTKGGIETIDFMRAKSTPEEFRGFCKLNALKYIARDRAKQEGFGTVDTDEDLKKAIVYLQWAVGKDHRGKF